MTPITPLKPRPRGNRKPGARSEIGAIGELPPVQHGYVKSFDGTKLFYSVEGKGKPLVFCYGLVCSSLHWTYQIERFSQNYQVIWVDYRGHQNSDVPKDLSTLTLENVGRDLGVVLDELNVKDAVFLGHSMGVNVVLEFFRQQPERVRAMVLANGTAKSPLETLFRHNGFQALFSFLKKAHEKSPELVNLVWKLQKGNPLALSMVTLGGFNPYLTSQADIQIYVDQVAEMDPEVFIRLFSNYDNYNATSWLHQVNVPTLILAGEQDKITPIEQQELLHQLIPGSKMERIRHGSHCPQMDLPELVNSKIERFLAELSYEPAPSPTMETASQSTETHPDPDQATFS
jgi:non-heme chloroperoxidase